MAGEDVNQKLLAKTESSEVEEVTLRAKVWAETKTMWIVAAPAIFTRFSTFGINVVSQAFIGHIGPTELAAYSLVFTVLLRFCNGVLLGMASALETLCGQSFGAKQYHMLGVYLQRSWLVLFICATLICGGCRETWKGFSFLAFTDLWPVIKLSLSSGAMLCLELWYNTVLVLLTGNMQNAEVAIDALAICLNINGWEMMISLGFLAAASVRVSNELGRGNSKAAKFSILMTVATSFVIGVVLFTIFLFLRGKIAYLFTESPEVVDAVADLSPLLAFSILLNSIQPVLSGKLPSVAIGAGWQSIVVYVNIACYYLVGIPVGVVLGYVFDLQVKGVWIGMLFGTFIQTIILVIITSKTDWDKQVLLARNRVNRWYVASLPESEEQN
ncbi:Protein DETOXIFICATION 21 [Linum grandiflorum]